MLVLLVVAFLAGVITAISPCVLPVLPILLAGSATSTDRRRPYAIVAGLVVSFTAFTLAGAALLSALGLPEDLLRTIAIVALLILAASLLSQRVAWLLERPFLFLTRRRVGQDSNGFLVGLSVGLVFVPCAGPVLAAVTALAASGEVTFRVVLVTGAYAIGAAIPMLAIAIGGQRLGSGMKVVRTHVRARPKGSRRRRRRHGDRNRARSRPALHHRTSRLHHVAPGSDRGQLDGSGRDRQAERVGQHRVPTGQGGEPRAPDFKGIKLWMNTPGGAPLSLAKLNGKVVLVDFWTYSCINCLRTLPHLKAWDRAYRKAGLTIVGVHSPEFSFERVPDNVRSAVQRLGVRYPVALDNDFATWRAYSNDYWPAEYLIDKSGHIRHEHYGEGSYGETESAIRGCSERRRTSRARPSPTPRRGRSRRPSRISAMRASIGSRMAPPPSTLNPTTGSPSASRRTSSPMPGAGLSSPRASSPAQTRGYGFGSRRATSTSSLPDRVGCAPSSTDARRGRLRCQGRRGSTRSRAFQA